VLSAPPPFSFVSQAIIKNGTNDKSKYKTLDRRREGFLKVKRKEKRGKVVRFCSSLFLSLLLPRLLLLLFERKAVQKKYALDGS